MSDRHASSLRDPNPSAYRHRRPSVLLAFAAVLACLPLTTPARPVTSSGEHAGTGLSRLIASRRKVEKQLEQIAIIRRMVMVPMRDGKRMEMDIYRPRHAHGKVPVIFRRTPYNHDYWDVRHQAPAYLKDALDAVRHGYAYVIGSERGTFFSEGHYEILGAPTSDGSDEIHWLASRPWSNGRVGLTGCSSSAEWQLAVVSRNDPGLATFNVQEFGAGVGHVGPYYEQGNWFRGGAMRMVFIEWLYEQQNPLRPMFPENMSRKDRVRAAKMFDLSPHLPDVDWSQAFRHLPVRDIIKAAGGPPGVFADREPVPSGGDMIDRTPDDPAWYKGGLWHQGMPIRKPGLWFMSWYDFSVSPNLAAYNWVRAHAPKSIADQQYAVIAPVLHCAFRLSSKHTMVGHLDVGDARLNYKKLMYGWFDHFLKGKDNGILRKQPKVLYYLIGANVWKGSPTWPPPGATPRTFYLHSRGHANTIDGDGSLSGTPQRQEHPDRFTYDPGHPVMSHGGCCIPPFSNYGAFDQTPHEHRDDVLVYQTAPFQHGFEASGPITMTLYVSSSAKDTDFTFKLMDVYPDGKAYNLTENIQRMRWRDGYEHAPVWMHPGTVYKVTFQPIDISNYFAAGHRLRVSVSSSNFPRFDRNLNTGGDNEADTHWVLAHNVIHHDRAHPSRIVLTVEPARRERAPRPDHARR